MSASGGGLLPRAGDGTSIGPDEKNRLIRFERLFRNVENRVPGARGSTIFARLSFEDFFGEKWGAFEIFFWLPLSVRAEMAAFTSSKAELTILSFSCADSRIRGLSANRSGCQRLTSRRYALLASLSVASGETCNWLKQSAFPTAWSAPLQSALRHLFLLPYQIFIKKKSGDPLTQRFHNTLLRPQ